MRKVESRFLSAVLETNLSRDGSQNRHDLCVKTLMQILITFYIEKKTAIVVKKNFLYHHETL